MELELFDFIERTLDVYENDLSTYNAAEEALVKVYEEIVLEHETTTISIHSRVKSRESLREKLLRNKYYYHFDDPQDALEHLSDLVGLTIECRFIRNEAEIYKNLFKYFETDEKGFSRCRLNDYVYLNLRSVQPQVQRNGYTIYRLDGFCDIDGQQINYELQIKALVHRFWSEIEHEVVYKNPEFVIYDRFIRNMLGSVRDSLEVVDRQLEILYDELSYESGRVQIGLDDTSFKVMCASSINDLVNVKMQESVGFRSDFKKCSAILAQYIYIRYFINGVHNKARMLDFLEHLNYLAANTIAFETPVFLNGSFQPEDPFLETIGNYWLSMMNNDFEWHVFFVMLFAIQPGDNLDDFMDFAKVIKILLIQPTWYDQRFETYNKYDAQSVKDHFEFVLAQALVESATIEMIHEDNLYQVSQVFKDFIDRLENDYPDYKRLEKRMDDVSDELKKEIIAVFD